MFIGRKKIKTVKETDDPTIKEVTFMDKSSVKIKQTLLDMIKRDEVGEGEVTDSVLHVIGAKFLQELADYDLEFYMVEMVAARLQTFIHNLREEAVGKKFNCKGNSDIKIKDILNI